MSFADIPDRAVKMGSELTDFLVEMFPKELVFTAWIRDATHDESEEDWMFWVGLDLNDDESRYERFVNVTHKETQFNQITLMGVKVLIPSDREYQHIVNHFEKGSSGPEEANHGMIDGMWVNGYYIYIVR